MALLQLTVKGTQVCLPVRRGVLLSEVLRDRGQAPAMPCAGQGRCGKCRVLASGALSPPSPAERAQLTPEDLDRGVRLACCTRLEGDCRVTLSHSAHSQICLDGAVDAAAFRPRFRTYGAAVDIGTTTLAASLYGPEGTLLTQASGTNPQAAWGADVISRIEAALKGEGGALAACVRGAIDGLLERMAAQVRIAPEEIDALVITGNTAMLHLFTETSPEPLSHAPFAAQRLFGEVCPAAGLGLSACPGASVCLPRCISAFVGADVTTSLLSSGICGRDETRMLVDIGTNGEMALTQKDVRMVQLAKSAISAGLRTLMHTAGISCPDIAELAVAGGFGSYLDAANAGRIGLIPQELVSRVRVLGNAALSGASMLLLDRELAPACEYLAQSAKILELSANPVFTQYYMEGMFF